MAAAIAVSGTTSSTTPSSIAVFGIPNTTLVSRSCAMVRPPAGSYEVYAVSVSSDDGGSSRAQLTGWVVTDDSGQEATTAPDPLTVTGNRDVDITVRFGRLDPTQRWFGYLDYADSSRRTYLTVE